MSSYTSISKAISSEGLILALGDNDADGETEALILALGDTDADGDCDLLALDEGD